MLRARSTFVGRPFCHVYPSQSTVLKIWNRVVPIQSSVNVPSLSAVQTFSVCSKASSRLVRVCLVTSTYQKHVECPFAQNVHLWSMYFVVVIYEVTTQAPKVFSVFFFERCVFLLFFARWQLFHCPSSHVYAGRKYNPVQMGNNTHVRKLIAVHPERPSVRAPSALTHPTRYTLAFASFCSCSWGYLNSSSA